MINRVHFSYVVNLKTSNILLFQIRCCVLRVFDHISFVQKLFIISAAPLLYTASYNYPLYDSKKISVNHEQEEKCYFPTSADSFISIRLNSFPGNIDFNGTSTAMNYVLTSHLFICLFTVSHHSLSLP